MTKLSLGLAAALLAAGPLAVRAQNAPAAVPTTALPAAATPTTTDANAVKLLFKFAPGQIIRYKMGIDTKGQIMFGDKPMPMNQHMDMVLRQTVKDINAATGAATLETGVDSMTMTMNGQARPMPADQMAKMKNMVTTVMLPSGKVLSTKINSQAAGGGMMPGMNMAQNNMVGSGSLGLLPDKAIKVGDTWKSAPITAMQGLKLASDFVLTGITTIADKKTAGIVQSTTGDIQMGGNQPPAAPPAPGQPGVATATPTPGPQLPPGMSINGKMTGKTMIHFDVDAGAIADTAGTMFMNMTMNMPQAAAARPGGFTMQMQIDTNMKRMADTDAAAPATTTAPAAADPATGAPATPAQ